VLTGAAATGGWASARLWYPWLTLGTGGLLIVGTLAAAVVLRSADRVLHAVDKPTVELI
jgi:hypothetical protein